MLKLVLELFDQDNTYDVTVTSSKPLVWGTKSPTFWRLFPQKFIKTRRLVEKIDEDLIGGFVIKAKNKVVDTSIRSQLQTFGKQFEIESGVTLAGNAQRELALWGKSKLKLPAKLWHAETGVVTYISDGIARVSSADNAMSGEFEFEMVPGMAQNETNDVVVFILRIS